MKTILFSIGLFFTLAASADPVLPKTLTTLKGKSYTGVALKSVEPDGIRIVHDTGLAKLRFEDLPETLRSQFAVDPEKAAAFRAEQEARQQENAKRIAAAEQKIAADRAQASSPLLPGLSPVDLYLNLEKEGFTTQKRFGEAQNEWTCTRADAVANYSASAFGPGGQTSKIATVQATVAVVGEVPVNDTASEFLSFIATLPISGGDPAKAKAWVASNVGTTAECVIGGVKFQLFANAPRARALRITAR